MQLRSKLMAVLLISVMVVAQIPMALAGGEASSVAALMDGREITYTGKVTWHANPMLDEETNGLIASLLDATTISGRFAYSDDQSYSQMDLLMQGQSALSIENVLTADGSYVRSSLLPAIIAIEPDEIGPALTNVLAAFENMAGLPTGTIASQFEAMMAQSQAQTAALENIDLESFMELIAALSIWAEGAVAGETFDGDIASAFDLDIASATLYEITPDEVLELLQTTLPLIRDNDAIWTLVLQQMESTMLATGEEMPTEEEFMDEMRAALDEAIADLDDMPEDYDFTLYYAECYDADGNVNTNMAEFAIPSDYEALDIYAEWTPEGDQIHFWFTYDSDGFALDITAPKPEAVQMKGLDASNRTFSALLSVIEYDEVIGQVGLDYENQSVKMNNTATSEGNLQLYAIDVESEETMGATIRWSSETNPKGDVDFECKSEVDVEIFAYGETIPLVTLSCSVASGEPQGLPFDPADETLEFFHPGAVTEEEYITWIEESVSVSAMQGVFKVLSLLPPDIMSLIAEDLYF